MSKNRDLIYDMTEAPETEDFEQLDSEPLQLGGGVDPHAGDLFCPRLVPGRVTAAFVADEKRAAGAQHAADLAEAFWQVRPQTTVR